MKFGPVPVAEAAGEILAHSVEIWVDGLPETIRKGHLLTPADVAQLVRDGIAEVTVARLGPDDVHEDEAATRIARALLPDAEGQGLRRSRASTGRVNIHAEAAGVLRIDAGAVHALNRINPMITLATLAPFHRVGGGEMVATVKIISYGVPEADVARGEAAIAGAMSVAAPVYASASMIETMVRRKEPPLKGWNALKGRLQRLGVMLDERVLVPHRADELAEALKAAPGEVLFILTGSATSDPQDVGPEAVRLAGGEVVHVGMPVDPGNLLFLGRLDGKPVIGLPGCARSPALNGADWVLERVICGIPVGPEEIAAMGVGGLLKEIPIRPRPRESDRPV